MSQSLPEIVISETPSPADREAILRPLLAYNDRRGPPSGFQPLAISLRDPTTGETVGGLWGKSSYDWVFIDLLFVPEQWRGQNVGTLLLRKAEEIGRVRDCIGLWLDTFGFQARGFYEKNGFELFGTLDDHPRGSKCYFMRKLLQPKAPSSSTRS
ncbi:GNAT family N-acetyltransferase [Microvirga zambiensis]|uniref:GNAT family N-acetyltransferase n=1 Tax=Microvirga zambiensis TaxID=1402137 RepID=UPI00191CBDEC|nr:GNAT family N-acetyltransferase [Microvirga zambiensis]